MKLSASSLLHSFHKTNALTASIRRGLIFSTVMLSVNVAFADIVIDDDNTGGGGINTITAPNPHTVAADITDTSGAAIRINDTNGANGLLTINGGVTVSSSSAEAVILDGGGTTSVSITNAGTLSSVLNGLLVQNAAELTAFNNTGGIIESTGAAGAGLYLQEDQDNAITNAGIIRNTSSGDGLKLDTEAQTQDFTNTGAISSATGIAINADIAMTGATNGFVNSGTITGGGGIAIDAEAAFKLTNSGTITGDIAHATAGALTINQTAGSITGNITSTANAAHSLNLTGGSISGNITLNGATANTFVLNGTAITGSVDLGDGAANSVTLTTGSISGSLDIGANTTAVSINTGGGDSATVATFDSLNATVNMTGAGTFNSTTFENNSTVNQSAGIANITTLNIGANDTYTQTGTGVLNTTTTNVGNGATLTLLNQGTGIIQGTADNQGALVFSGSYNADAVLGTAANSLASITVNAGQVLSLDQNSDVTTFNDNGTVNQSAGTLAATTLNIGANDTFNQSGTAVINSTTMNIGAGASFVQTGSGQLNATTTIIDFGGSLTIANQGTGIIEGKTDDKGSVVFSGNYNTDAALGTLGKALTSVTVNAGQVLTLDQDSYVTTFNDNGTVNQSAGTLTAATLNIGDNDTYTQTGTGVLNTTTTNLGNGATLTLLNQGTGIIQGAADGQGDVIFSGSYNTDAALGIPNKALASVTVNVGQVLTLDQNSDVTTFNNNGTVNQSAGTLTAATLNIGDNDTFTQTGTGVVNSTTTNVGNGATLTLLNQGTGIIRGAADGQGDVVFSGSYNTDAALGESLRTLASITVNAGQVLSLDQDGDVTTFNNNGTVNQSAGTLAATTLNIGDNDTYTQTGTGVLNTTTTNVGNGATLTLLNQGTGIIRGAADGQGDVVFSGSYNTDAILGSAVNSLALITVNAGQTLTLDQNSDATSVVIAGILNKSSTSTMTGNTTINDGAIMNIANNFTHTGNLTVGQSASGVVSVDEGITTAVIGNYTQTANGIFQLGASSNSNYGQMTVTGTASFASNARLDVDVNTTNTLAVGETFLSVVSAGTVISDGTFKVTDNSALFNFTGAINGNTIDVFVVDADSVVEIVERLGPPSALGAAAIFDDWVLNGGDTPEVADVLQVFGKLETEQAVADAVESSIPGLSAGVAQATSSSIKGLTKMINSRQDLLRGLSSGDDLIADKNFWIAPYGSWTDQDDRQGVSGYSIDSYGLAMGMDADFSSSFNLGLSAAYTRSDIDSRLAAGEHNIDVDSYQAKIYATAMLDEFTALNIQLGGGISNYDSQRKVFTLDVADVDYDSWHAQFNAELEHSIFLENNVVLTPYIFADYSYVDVDGYEENGAAALNLTADDDSDETLIVGLGSKADYLASEDLLLLADLGVGYDFMARRSNLTSAFEGGGGQFSTEGIKPDEFVYTAGLGLIYSLDNGSEITGRYDFYGREDFTDQAVSIRLSMLF
jgi:uncharacterized protein with beta-barrel porin domain